MLWGISTKKGIDPKKYLLKLIIIIFLINIANKCYSDGIFVFSKKWGTSGSAAGQFSSPTHIAIDSKNNIYIVDFGNNRIQKFDPDGIYITQWGSIGFGNGQFTSPRGICTDSFDNIYVIDGDADHPRIQKFDSNGTFITQWTRYTNAPMYTLVNPIDCVVDKDGNVLVTDNSGYYGIVKFTSNGVYISKLAGRGQCIINNGIGCDLSAPGAVSPGDGQFGVPVGIAVDVSGNIYVVDGPNNRIEKFDSNGTFITKWGIEGTSTGQFLTPGGIGIDTFQNNIITDQYNNRIEKFTPNGIFISQLGGQFNSPDGIKINSLGNIYVVDSINNQVEVFVFQDTVPPSASISVLPSSPLRIGQVAVILSASEQLNSTPTLSFLSQVTSTNVYLSNPSGDKINWTGIITISTVTGDGLATFSWNGSDLYGNSGTQITSGSTFFIATDTIPPIGIISINNGTEISKSQNVTLLLSAFDDATSTSNLKMTFSNDGVTFTQPEPFSPTKQWQLSPLAGGTLAGPKQVFVKFIDQAGNSSIASASIILDISKDPSAAITLSSTDRSLLQSSNPAIITPGGTAVVRVITSQQVNGAPIFSLALPDGTTTAISLTGSSVTWTGNFVIPSTMLAGIGTFSYFATGVSGSTSSDITSGRTLIIGRFPQYVTSGVQILTLVTSKQLLPSPTLYLILPDGTSTQVVASNSSGDGVTWLSTIQISSGITQGTATFSIQGTDLFGNPATQITFGNSFIIDTTPPTVTFSVQGTTVSLGDSVDFAPGHVEININAVDPVVSGASSGVNFIEYSLDGGPIMRTYSSLVPLNVVLSSGTHFLTAHAFDNAGNESVDKTLRIEILSHSAFVSGSFTWSSVSSMSIARSSFSATLLLDGRVLVAGGQSVGNVVVSSAEIYDPVSRSWSPTGSMNQARYSHTAILLSSGKVLVAGGNNSNATLNSSELYDPATGKWKLTKGSMNQPRAYQAAVKMNDGKVLEIGGLPYTSSCEIYDPAQDLWISTSSMSDSRAFISNNAVLLQDGRVLVAGGQDVGNIQTVTSEIFDPKIGLWSPTTGSMNNPHNFGVMALLNNGNALMTGGCNCGPSALSEPAEFYNVVSGTWSNTSPMNFPRIFQTVTLLFDGRVLVAGGQDQYSIGQSTAELYDTSKNLWTYTNSLLTARSNHTATLLLDGNVLVTGGNDAGGRVISSAELFNATSISTSAPNPVTDLFGSGTSSSTIHLTWTATGNSGSTGQATAYDLRYGKSPIQDGTCSIGQNCINFADATYVAGLQNPSVSGTMEKFTVGGLNSSTTYYFALKVINNLGNSSLSNVPSAQTFFAAYSTVTIGGVPEVTFIANSSVPITVTQVSTTSLTGQVVLGTVTAQGFSQVSNIYQLGPEGLQFSTPAVMTFYYSTFAIPAGVPESQLQLFEYITSSGQLVAVPNQVIDTTNHVITVTLSTIASIFVILAPAPDIIPPITQFIVYGSSFVAQNGNIYVSGTTGLLFKAIDPVVKSAYTSGVKSTVFKVDSGTFQNFVSSFTLSEGVHAVTFYSTDFAGNVESTKSAVIKVDATPPQSQVFISTPQIVVSKVTVIGAQTPILISAQDVVSSSVASGVRGLNVTLDNSTQTAPVIASSFTITTVPFFFNSGGTHTVSFFATDNVGNTELTKSSGVIVDTSPPIISISSPMAGNRYLALKDKININFSVIDNYDPSPSSNAYLVSNQIGTNSYVVPVSNGQAIEPLSIPTGFWHLQVNAGDFAGNISSAGTGTFEVVHDTLPPRTQLNLAGIVFNTSGSAQQSPQGATFITSQTALILSATDDLLVTGDGIGLGVKQTLFAIDSTTYSLYSGSFTLAEGLHNLSFYSMDVVGNMESTHTTTLNVDNTPPVTQISILGDQFSTGNLIFVSPRTNFVFTSRDPMVNGVASGVRSQTILVDGSTVSLGVLVSSLSAVSLPLQLLGGTHTISFFAMDNVGNQELVKSTSVIVDTQPPGSRYNLTGAEFILNGSTYITSQTGLTLSAIDDLLNPGDGIGVGVKETRYGIDASSFSPYFSSFNILGDGNHNLNFYSRDEVNNVESTQTAVLLVDNTPPISQFSIFQGPSYLNNSQSPLTYVSTTTLLALSAQDPIVNGVASGVKSTQFGVAGVSSVPVTLNPYLSPFAVNEGTRTISFDSIDNLGNQESTKTVVILADGTPPKTQISVSGAEFDTGTVNTVGSAPLQQFVPLLPSATMLTYINGDSRIQLSAQDPISNGVASGVKNTFYAIRTFNYDGSGMLINSSTSPYQIYLATSFPLTEGVRDVLYFSEDNVLNTESVNMKQYRVDATSPSVRLSFIGGTQFRPDSQNPSCCSDTLTYVSGDTAYRFDIQDTTSNNVMSGAKEMEIAFDSGSVLGGPANIGNNGVISTSFTVVQGTFAIFTPCPICLSSSPYSEGEHLFRFHGQDYAGNVSVDSVTYINVDRTPPVTQFIITGTQFVSNGTVYVNTTTAFGFTAQDPVVNKVASGVKRTLYSIDGGQYQTFASNFTLPEGIHTIQFYSQDNVANTEKTQSVILYVDGTPPVTTISISTPQFTAFGTVYISQKTPITLSAVDPIVKGVSSGVNRIQFTIDSLPLMNYTTSFTIQSLVTISTGTHRIIYYSQDNVGNTEIPKFQDVFVSILPDFALVGVSGISLNGQSQAGGDLRSNGTVLLNGQAVVTGNVYGSTVTLIGKSTVTANVVGNAPLLASVPMDLVPIASSVTLNNNDSQIPKTQKGQTALGTDLHLVVQAKDTLTLSGGTYFFTGIDILGGSSVTVTGNAQIYCTGSVNVSGGSRFNAGGNTTGLILFVNAATGTISVSGGSELDGTFYAPYSTVSVNGISRVIGNVFGLSGMLDGQSVVAINSQLLSTSTATTTSKNNKVAALAFKAQGPSPDFVLGEVYSFPNPAVGGKKPTLHIECGIADSVEIRIYDIAGGLVHEMRLDQLPQAGWWTPQSGLKYAYEYTWDTSGVASGVYIYVIVAKKSGEQDIRVMKKCAVVK